MGYIISLMIKILIILGTRTTVREYEAMDTGGNDEKGPGPQRCEII